MVVHPQAVGAYPQAVELCPQAAAPCPQVVVACSFHQAVVILCSPTTRLLPPKFWRPNAFTVLRPTHWPPAMALPPQGLLLALEQQVTEIFVCFIHFTF